MSVWFKQGVYGDLTTICQKAFGLLANFYNSQGLDFLCTSKRDGNHSAGSLHYTGNAFDFKRLGKTPKGLTVIELDKCWKAAKIYWDLEP